MCIFLSQEGVVFVVVVLVIIVFVVVVVSGEGKEHVM